ncbi:hypothetical protein AYO44_00200 [Planctomycetaceae bacterium SCGC AG-212-F19]|nr:hypothetical protein AYO44_00200 [Planctomycetaceae bacterium SCGC AG-212-F19]
MKRTCGTLAIILLAATSWAADPSKHKTKIATVELPKELADPVRALLSDQAIQVLDDQGKVYAEVWFRKELPVKATSDDFKKGIAYNKVEEGTIVGALRLSQAWQSFRKQNVKPGVYTLRLGIQPMDGDHMGSAPFNEFLLLCPAADDKKTAILKHKEVTELSGKALPGGNHPVVLLMFPNPKPEPMPALVNKGGGIWVLNTKADAAAGTDKGVLGVGLVLFGVTTAE